eukprot:TRINITY_DN2396_c0_g1_i3.p1 TRINITY_DN2396_c0_g1~~TRINITY_DN2396_c0_g1_i3.p1  ORF type:complete len:265 (+),score=55.10 TRINITY_DN2396_c0_g1_i3:137-931(+)
MCIRDRYMGADKNKDSIHINKNHVEIYKNPIQIQIALAFQILTPQTALICKIMKATDETKQYFEEHKEAEKYFVPLIESVDYDIQQDRVLQMVDQLCDRSNNLDHLCAKSHSLQLQAQTFYKKSQKSAGLCGQPPLKHQQNPPFNTNNQLEEQKQQEPKKQINQSGNILLEIIKLQKIEGFWQFTEEIIKALQIENKQFQKALKQLNISEDQLITIMILIWLEDFHQNEYESWKLIAEKAITYLSQQSINVNEMKVKCKDSMFN